MSDTAAAPDKTAPATSPGAPRSVTAVVGLLVLFELVSGFLQTGITPLLPDIGDYHGVSDSALNWVVSVQLLSGAVLVPVFGRLGDLYGHRRMLRLALASTAVGTLLVALAPSFVLLLLGRVLQGALVALLPLEIALVRDRLPVEQARRAIARLVGALTLGSLLGAVAMGALDRAVDDIRLVLLVPALLVAACVPVAFLLIPESESRAEGGPDWPGAILLGTALIALLAGVSRAEHHGWLSAGVLLSLLAFAVLISVWVRIESRSDDPLVDLRAMKGRHVAPFYLTSFFFGVLYFGSQSPNSTFLAADPATNGYGFGMKALSISLAGLPAALGALVTSSCTALIARRWGYRPTLMAAFSSMTAGFLGLSLFHDALWQVVTALLLCGVGAGAALGAMPTVIVETTSPARTGVATALYNNVKTVGGAVAGGVIASLLASLTSYGDTTTSERGYVVVWMMCAAFGLAAVAAVAFAHRREDSTNGSRALAHRERHAGEAVRSG